MTGDDAARDPSLVYFPTPKQRRRERWKERLQAGLVLVVVLAWTALLGVTIAWALGKL